MSTRQTRLDKVSKRIPNDQVKVSWLEVQDQTYIKRLENGDRVTIDQEEYDRLAARCKTYSGVSPDDWNE